MSGCDFPAAVALRAAAADIFRAVGFPAIMCVLHFT